MTEDGSMVDFIVWRWNGYHWRYEDNHCFGAREKCCALHRIILHHSNTQCKKSQVIIVHSIDFNSTSTRRYEWQDNLLTFAIHMISDILLGNFQCSLTLILIRLL
ncbi:hypothetical protein EYC84_007178 [Monilinia fructicola]|uniref:Uncharacterized protein n=1 Tax=Monilinia fructicola TaxID=38448 RepID=A0A5M9K9X6_MONFR|nr:hypothetical protein EYC84_007178 [Monilinia fructicola]